ncbi:MAG: M23 family metallopeptidase [Oscillospiraceae bacterium]|nr:M23 family metallopeptidase [Oscillospiraceae bacterium]
MKKSFSETPVGKFLLGKGFYTALAVCVLGAGAAAWVIVDKTIDSFSTEPPAVSTPALQNPVSQKEQKVQQEVSNISRPSSSSSSAAVSSSAPAVSSKASESSVQDTISPSLGVSSFLLPVEDTVFNLFSGTELVKDETLDKWHTHNGIDIKAEMGSPVRAVADGVVSLVKDDPMWGTVVEITHGDDLISRYCGLQQELSVVEGQAVSIADEIGQVGDTNLAETALQTHLHFELFEDGVRVDPLDRMGFYNSAD